MGMQRQTQAEIISEAPAVAPAQLGEKARAEVTVVYVCWESMGKSRAELLWGHLGATEGAVEPH